MTLLLASSYTRLAKVCLRCKHTFGFSSPPLRFMVHHPSLLSGPGFRMECAQWWNQAAPRSRQCNPLSNFHCGRHPALLVCPLLIDLCSLLFILLVNMPSPFPPWLEFPGVLLPFFVQRPLHGLYKLTSLCLPNFLNYHPLGRTSFPGKIPPCSTPLFRPLFFEWQI